MKLPKEFIDEFYFEINDGVTKNKLLDIIPVTYKNKRCEVHLYISRDKITKSLWVVSYNIRKYFIEKRYKNSDISTVDEATSIKDSNGNQIYLMLEWNNWNKGIKNLLKGLGDIQKALKIIKFYPNEPDSPVQYEFIVKVNDHSDSLFK